jgi:hypothetical protein
MQAYRVVAAVIQLLERAICEGAAFEGEIGERHFTLTIKPKPTASAMQR